MTPSGTKSDSAPIVIVGGRGYQVINQAPDASLRAPIGA